MTRHARILGLGTYRPSRVVTNEDICRQIDSTDEWIRTRSGIASRRFAGPDETLLEMAAAAAEKAVANSGVEPSRIGAVVLTTTVQPNPLPTTAPRIAQRLGADCIAFDMNGACAGFTVGLGVVTDMIRAGTVDYAVLIGVERFSEHTDKTDRSTAFIFADGAGAVVLGPSDEPAIGPVVWGSDGSQSHLIQFSRPWSTREEPLDGLPTVLMEGREVFRWAAYKMVPVAQQALAAAGKTIDDLDAFIPHQANLRITEAMCRALKVPEHVAVARDIVHSGNTSAASIPLAMETLLTTGEVPSGGTALLIGFGAGLTYAAQVVNLP